MVSLKGRAAGDGREGSDQRAIVLQNGVFCLPLDAARVASTDGAAACTTAGRAPSSSATSATIPVMSSHTL